MGFVMSLAVLIVSLLGVASPAAVPLILDTDMGGGGCRDVDDVAALCMLHALVDNGEVDLLAVVVDTSPPSVPGAVSILNHYYGHDDVPIGSYQGDGLSPDAEALPWVDDLLASFPSPIRNASQVPSALEVYRRVLAAQPDDASVVISSIGLLTNLADLLASGPDRHSALNGYDLVAKKVAYLAVMGGKYPDSGAGGGPECNFCGGSDGIEADSATARAATANVVNAGGLPPSVRVVFSGFEVGVEVQSGGQLSSCAPVDSPCRRAFEDYGGGPNRSRYSWDPLSTLAAVRGWRAASCQGCDGCDGGNSADAATGDNAWIPGAATNQTYLILTNATAAGNAIDELLCQPAAGAGGASSRKAQEAVKELD